MVRDKRRVGSRVFGGSGLRLWLRAACMCWLLGDRSGENGKVDTLSGVLGILGSFLLAYLHIVPWWDWKAWRGSGDVSLVRKLEEVDNWRKWEHGGLRG